MQGDTGIFGVPCGDEEPASSHDRFSQPLRRRSVAHCGVDCEGFVEQGLGLLIVA